MKTFDIYFSDLNEESKKRLLDFVGAKSASDMNWDMDILPIAQFDADNEYYYKDGELIRYDALKWYNIIIGDDGSKVVNLFPYDEEDIDTLEINNRCERHGDVGWCIHGIVSSRGKKPIGGWVCNIFAEDEDTAIKIAYQMIDEIKSKMTVAFFH